MKITFSNLGAIKKTTLDLRPLTVIIGPNNSNKTYIAYSIYGLLNSIVNSAIPPSLSKFIKKANDNSFSVTLDDNFYNFFVQNIYQHIESFKNGMNNYFQDTSKKLFTKTEIKTSITIQKIKKAVLKISDSKLSIIPGIEVSFNIEKAKLFIKPIINKNSLFEISNTEAYMFTAVAGLFYRTINQLFLNPFILPAERNALVITYKMLANRRFKALKQNHKNLLNTKHIERQIELLKEQGDLSYPQPIEKFLDFLADIELENEHLRATSDQKRNFENIANIIEESIQCKNRTALIKTNLGGKELKIHVKSGLDIDLYNASSSIKQLTPLLLYLRYSASVNDLLIIDEPELNLHPESQAKLLEVLGMLVNEGVNVLLTTHSPYFMSHLNNLVSGKTDDEKILKEQAKSLYLKDERAFLTMGDVSAYEMKNNKLKDLKDKDYGIRWDTLSDVSADIQQKFYEIYEKGEEPTDGKEE